MSTTIDERVVSLQFDNKQFEQNVSTTMSTLEKLKQKLNFSGASKGLETINEQAAKTNLGPLSSAVETIGSKFSAMEVMGITALANITNSAVNAGKRIVSALTIDPIKSGFEEYETQINSTQTILANVSSKGSTIDDVNKALEELNLYADKTIYNFTEMTRNIGTFTAAGIDLETSVNAIQGIANLAAVSGSTSQQASTAMYQLSQALAAGTVKLQDWNSVVNAGMGGEMFQNALRETSELLGTGAEAAIEAKGSFRESLQEGWITAEVLTETLKKFTTTGANEYIAEYTGLTKEAVEAETKQIATAKDSTAAIDEAAEALAKKSGKNKEEIKQALQFAQNAEDAATKVKTFTQLWDVLKESAQSGWAQTWKIIVGDFEEAKALFTPLADFLTGALNKMSEARNKLLESALGKSFTELGEKIKGITDPISKSADSIKNVVDTIKDYDAVVDEILGGKWGNGQERWDSLTEAGYDWAHAQNMVNEKLGDGTRHATDYAEAQDKTGKAQENTKKSQGELIESLVKYTDEQLKAKGYTQEQIDALRELEKQADKTGIPIKDFIANIDEINGRWLLINSFKNIGQSIVKIFTAIGTAWRDAFPPMSADTLYNIIAAIHKFSTYLVLSDDGAKKLTRTLKGVFAAVDILVNIVSTFTNGAFKLAFKIIQEVLKALGWAEVDILSITANIGDAIVAFRNWIEEHNIIYKVIEKLVPMIVKFVKSIGTFVKEAYNMPAVQKAISKVTEAWDLFFGHVGGRIGKVLKWFTSLDKIALADVRTALSAIGNIIADVFSRFSGDSELISGDFISGFVNGIRNGIGRIFAVMYDLGMSILESIKEVLGIHSPSVEAEAVGGHFMDGLVLGFQNGLSKVIETVKGIGTSILDTITGLDWSGMFAGALSGGMIFALVSFMKALNNLTAPLEGVSSMLGGVGDLLGGVGETLAKSAGKIKKILNNVAKVVKSFSKILNAQAFKIRTEGFKNLAISIAIIAGSLYVLSTVDQESLKTAGNAIGQIAIVMVGLAFAIEKIGGASTTINKDGVKINSTKGILIGLGAAILLIGMTAKMIGKLDPAQYDQAMNGILKIMVGMGVMVILLSRLENADGVDAAGKTLLKISSAVLILSFAMKMIGKLDPAQYNQAMQGITTLLLSMIAIILLLTKIERSAWEIQAVGDTILRIGIAMGILAIVLKLIAKMEWEELGKGAAFVGGFVVFVLALSAISKYVGGISEVGKTLLAISGAMLILVVIMKLIGGMEPEKIAKGIAGLVGLTVVVGLLVAIVKRVENDAPKIALTLLALSVAIGILAAVAILLSFVSVPGLAKGVIAVGLLGGVMAGMIVATRGAEDVKGSIMAMAVAIGVMAAAIVVLSFIDPKKLVGPVLAMSALMGMFALILKTSKDVTGAMGSLIVMTVAIGIMATVLYILSGLPIESTLGAAVSLSVLMLSMTVVLKIVSKIGMMGASALLGVVALLAMAVPLLAFVRVLALMQNVQNAMANTQALILLTGALTLLLLPLTLVGTFAGAALLGIVALLAMTVPLRAFVGVLALMQNIQNASANVLLLTTLMTTLTGCLLAISLVAPLAILGVTAMTALTGLIVAIGVLVTAVGALMTEFPQLETFIDTGIPILVKLATGLGEMISGFMTGLTSGLPEIGMSLGLFMVNATPFIVGAKMVDESVLAGVGILTTAILALTAADLIEGIASFLSGGTSFSTLGTELSNFIINAMPFITMSRMIDPSIMEGVKSLAEAVLILTGADILEGLTSWLTGGSSLADFGSQLGGLGTNLSSFVTNLGTFTEDQVASVDCAGRAIKALAEAASTIPNEGGWAGKILGENSLATFGGYLPGLGTNLNSFITNLGTFGEDSVTAVDCAGKAIKSLAEAANTIPNDGGLWGKIFGENSLATFSGYLPGLGTNLNSFITNLGTFDDATIQTVNCAGEAIKTLAAAANTIPDEGGLWSKIFGDNSIATFSSYLPGLGTNLAAFATNLGTMTDQQVSTVYSACRTIEVIATLGSTDLKDTGKNLGTFGDKLVDFGGDISSFISSIANVGSDSISSAISKMKDLITMTKSVASVNVSSLKTFGNSLKNVAKDGVKDFAEGFSGESPKTKVKNAIEALINALIKAAKGKKDDVKKAFKVVADEALSALESESLISSFESAGKDLGDGLVIGIKAKEQAAYDAGYALGQKAVQGEKDGQKSNSPSKATIQAGKWLGEGLVIGIDRMGKSVYNAGQTMGEKASTSITGALGTALDLLNGDIDSQPTIRPILDLSDVTAGANTLNGMFNLNPAVGVSANLGAISSMMNNRQNGASNDDVVSAIDGLRKSLGDIGNTTYNVNGITYDDGSNVSSAVESLIRAARVQRRI